MCNLQYSFNWHFCRKNCAVRSVCYDFNNVAFLHKFGTCNLMERNRNLFESFLIHKDISCWVLIKILVRTTLNTNIFKLKSYLECTLKYATIRNILQFGNHNRIALPRLPMLKVDTSPNLSIKTDTCSDFDFL